jgi:membrane protein implicated in regulation of membrane protease activity
MFRKTPALSIVTLLTLRRERELVVSYLGVSISVFVAVFVGTEIVLVVGLLVMVAVAAILTIVLAVLQTLLKVRSVSVLIVVAILVFVAILILALLCGNRGSRTKRAEPGEADSKRQHPHALF